MCTIGIDPGQKGGVVALSPDGEIQWVEKFDGHKCPGELVTQVYTVMSKDGPCDVVIEDVHAAPGQGVTSMFNFGVGLGTLLGWLESKGIPYIKVSPQRWQRVTGNIEGKPKDRAKAFAYKQWGDAAFIGQGCRVGHSGLIDAACIAEYLRQVKAGGIAPPPVRLDKPKKRKRAIVL